MNVILPEDVGKIDQRAAAEYGIPTLLLMEHAALALRDAAMKKAGDILVICGTGGNGGDGFAAARLLYRRGRKVDVLFPFDAGSLRDDVKLNHDMACKLRIPIYNKLDASKYRSYGVILDCLLGTGLSRNVEENLAGIIGCINKSNAYVLSADIPSGINGETGHVMGCAVCADETVTFACEKPGLLLFPGREHTGKVTVADIGIPEQLVQAGTMHHYTHAEIARMLPERPRNSHKGHYGHVLVIAGSSGFMGAGGLCARGAVLGGAGLVTWAYPEGEPANPPLEAMTCPLPSAGGRIDAGAARDILAAVIENKSCIAIGPGLGVDTAHELLELLLKFSKPMLIDADAISALAQYNPLPRFGAPCIMTPHPGEMARILHRDTAAVTDNPVECAAELAARTNAAVILKMATSVIAAPGGSICFNTTGNPGMATGGSGDVLTGICAAFLARNGDPYRSAACAAYVHGLAGDIAAEKYGRDSMGSADIANCVAESYKSLIQYQTV